LKEQVIPLPARFRARRFARLRSFAGKRGVAGALLLVTACLATLLGVGRVQAQSNFDRPGGDYMSSPVESGDPADCALMCWLKSTVPPRVADNCCVSGVRGAGVVEPRNRAVETSIDRVGGDYRNFELKASEDDEACKAACTAENKCRAWTFARAGYVGKEPHCFLKKEIKPPRRRAGFTSGVVR
jgi:PAN domain